MKNRLAFSRTEKMLQMVLDAQQPQVTPPAARKTDRDLLVEMTGKIVGPTGATESPPATPIAETPASSNAQLQPNGSPTAESLGKFNGVDWIPAMLTLVFSLGIFIAILYGILFVYNRFVAKRMGRSNASQMIRQVASFHIAPKQRVVILEIQGERIACGVTPSQITFLTKITPLSTGTSGRKPAPRPGSGPGASAAVNSTGSKSGGASVEKKSTEQATSKNDPMQQFADALKEKVGAMKRIK